MEQSGRREQVLKKGERKRGSRPGSGADFGDSCVGAEFDQGVHEIALGKFEQ